jgi:hypothetical protein
MGTIEERIEQLEKNVSGLWNLTRILIKWIDVSQRGQDSLRAMVEQKEYKRLIEEIKDGAELIEQLLKGEKEKRLH